MNEQAESKKIWKKKMKNPVVSAILNFLFWGAGDYYNGRRKYFLLLLVSYLLMLNSIYFLAFVPIRFEGGLAYYHFPLYSLVSACILMSILFACDAYEEAKCELGGQVEFVEEETEQPTGLEKGDHLTIILDIFLVIVIVLGLIVIFYVLK